MISLTSAATATAIAFAFGLWAGFKLSRLVAWIKDQ